MKKTVLAVSVIMFSFSMAFAQKGIEDGSKYGHGEDSIRCLKNLSLYREYARNKNYDMALPFWRIPFNECPKSSQNLYIDGAKIFSDLVESENDELKREAYIDTLMMVYDQRIQYFGKRGYVLGRKGVDLLRYARDNMESIEEGYNILKESIKLEKKEPSDAVLATYFTAAATLYKQGLLDAEQVINDYVLISDLIDAQLSVKKDASLERIKEAIDQNFASIGVASCDKLVEIFTAKYENNKTDVKNLKNITSMLSQNDCNDSELFFAASQSLHELEPSAFSASNIARMSVEKGNFESASEYFQKAVELETDAAKKGDYYYGLAVVTEKLGKTSEARKYALEAANLKPNWGEPYIFIGNLYANSKNACSNLKLPNAIYWAAIDKFAKAKSVDPGVAEKADNLIKTYAPYFPNKEEAFFHGINAGDAFILDCWIGESTTARF